MPVAPIDPAELIKKVRRIELKTRRMVSSLFSGEYHSAFKGQGIEFSEVREYQYGDDVRNIDWNVSARMNTPYIKQFSEERELVMMLLIDTSASSQFGTTGIFRQQIITEIAAMLAFSAIHNNDKVGVMIFHDRVSRFLPPNKGRSFVLRIIRELLAANFQQPGTNLMAPLESINRMLKRRASVFILSDFITTGYEHAYKMAARKHDVIPVIIEDTLENSLPDIGIVRFKNPETGDEVMINTSNKKFRDEFHQRIYKQKLQRDQLFAQCNTPSIPISLQSSSIEPFMRYFQQRELRK